MKKDKSGKWVRDMTSKSAVSNDVVRPGSSSVSVALNKTNSELARKRQVLSREKEKSEKAQLEQSKERIKQVDQEIKQAKEERTRNRGMTFINLSKVTTKSFSQGANSLARSVGGERGKEISSRFATAIKRAEEVKSKLGDNYSVENYALNSRELTNAWHRAMATLTGKNASAVKGATLTKTGSAFMDKLPQVATRFQFRDWEPSKGEH